MPPDGFTGCEPAAWIDLRSAKPPAATASRNWLASEYHDALSRTPFSAAQALADAGITWRTITKKVLPASARVFAKRGLYQPDPEGGAAYLLPVRVDYPDTPETSDPEGTVCAGAIVDLIAFHPRHPARWARRIGNAEWLGAVEPQYLEPDPVRVWRSPLNWLRAGCIGIVPLTQEPPAIYRLLSGLRQLAVEDKEHEAELRSVLERPWPVPRITVGGRNGSTRREDGV